jgi:hypothetical protein
VTGGGAGEGDVPAFWWSGRGGVPLAGDPAFDALLAGDLLPDAAAGGLRLAAEVIAALGEPPAPRELAAEAAAIAVFRSAGRRPAGPAGSGHRRHRLLSALPGARLGAAAAAAAAAVALVGAAAAAYAGALPAPVQKLAHDTLGAPPAPPAPPARPARPAHPVTQPRPGGTAPAARGLCTAYARLKAQGSASQQAAAFRRLAAAAGGPASVTAYCAAVTRPGATPPGPAASHPGRPAGNPPSHPPGQPGHPGGKPASPPSGQPGHPGGKPASPPSGQPGHPGGKPTGTP